MKRFILAFIFYLLTPFNGDAKLTEKILSEDRPMLERFFQTLLFGSEFGYTLFGSKPLSVAVSYSPKELSAEYAILHKGWEIWDRYKNEFPSDCFILKKDTFPGKELCITIINKPALLDVIRKNIELFQLIFGEFPPEILSHKICHSEESIFALKSPHMQSVVGILLGFGRQNSLNFQKEIEIIQELNKRAKPPFFIPKESLSPMSQLFLNGVKDQPYVATRNNSTAALLQEAREIIDRRTSFNFSKTSFLIEKFLTPRFTCWENYEETAQLKQSYEKVQSTLRNAYSKGDFMEITLQQWVSSKGSNQ